MHLVPAATLRNVVVILFASGACSSGPAPASRPVPAPPTATARGKASAAATPALPPIPSVDGQLQLRVVYPSANQTLAVRDSNFIFGSTGSGRATLSINGREVAVLPNGAFLAWLPVPAGDHPQYELKASKGSASLTAVVPVAVRALQVPLPDTGRLVVDRSSITPNERLTLRSDERVVVSIRAPGNADVVLRRGDGVALTLSHRVGDRWSAEVAARALSHGGALVIRRGDDSTIVNVATVRLAGRAHPQYAELLNVNDAARSDTDQVSILRPAPRGTYKWFVFPGTVVEVTGQRGDFLRVRLDLQLEVWVEERAVKLLGDQEPARRPVAGDAHVSVGDGFSDLRIPVTHRAAYLVEYPSPSVLRLTLYGVTSNVDVVNFATADPSIRDVTWEQVATDRARFTVLLRHESYGYLAFWDRGALVLRVRRPPAINADRPLAGRVIAVDPGHPPAGATGPTGLYEGDAVLDVANQLKPLLESRGATVVMTRVTRDAVPLNARPIIARRANADALVSIHLNALPDGANPLRTSGTGTYFFHHQAEALARAVQRGMVHQLQLRDLGIHYDNLAVARMTWAPAILCEGAFVIVPEQEAALRNPEFQRRYAMGIAEGLEEFFRGIAVERGRR